MLDASTVLEFKLDVTQDGQSIVNDQREFSVLPGEKFELELQYDDKRNIFDARGAFTVYADILAEQVDAYRPILSESQIITLSENLEDATGGSISISGNGHTATVPVLGNPPNLANSAADALTEAIEVGLDFGVGSVTVFELLREPRDADGTVGSGDPYRYLIRFVADEFEFADVDLLSVDTSGIDIESGTVDGSVSEIDVFIDSSVPDPQINPTAFLFNLDARSSTFNDAIIYGNIQRGEFLEDSQNNTAIFNEVGGTGPLNPGGIPSIAQNHGVPSVASNIEVFSIELLALTPATGVNFTLDHADDENSEVSAYGIDQGLIDDEVLIDLHDDPATPQDDRFGMVFGTILEPPGVIVTPVGGLQTSEQGGTDTFDISLKTFPASDVTINLSSSNTDEGVLSDTTLTFTPSNATTPQTVTITGVDESIDDGDVSYTIVTQPTASDDPLYSGIDPADIAVVNLDNDTAGITLSKTNGLSTNETGSSDTYTIVLDSEPTTDVTIDLSSSNVAEMTASPASMTFTPQSWNVPQTVTVTGVDDVFDDGDMNFHVAATIRSNTDPHYDQIAIPNVLGTNVDDDVAGIQVTTSDLTTDESGTSISFSIALDTVPIEDVTIPLSVSDATEGQLSVTSVTFTPAGGVNPKIVTITGVDDQLDDGDITYTVDVQSAQSNDSAYNGINSPNFNVTNQDNDVSGVSVVHDANPSTSESGDDFTFTIQLDTIPSANVIIPLSTSDSTEAFITPSFINFSPANALNAQTVTVTGLDDELIDGDIAYRILIGRGISNDILYRIDADDIQAVNIDDDLPPISDDFGDAPAPYPTMFADDGARHSQSNLFLGTAPDLEGNGKPSALADADAAEDGVQFHATLVAAPGITSSSSMTVNASQAGKLDAWIDFNQDGDWLDAGEQIANSLDVISGDNFITFSVPAGSSSGTTFARFRISSQGGLSSTGSASDGEVEDHLITIEDGSSGTAFATVETVAGETMIRDENGLITVTQNTQILFSAGSATLAQLDIQGTASNDVYDVGDFSSSSLVFTVAAGAGDDTLVLAESQSLDLPAIGSRFQEFESIVLSGQAPSTITIDDVSVKGLSSTTDTLTVSLGPGGAQVLVGNWALVDAEIQSNVFYHVLLLNGATVRLSGALAWTNPVIPLDVNNNGRVSAIDALQILNQLRTRSFLEASTTTLVDAASTGESFPEKYYDTTADGILTPIDALKVINFIARSLAGEPELMITDDREQAADEVMLDDPTTLTHATKRQSVTTPARHTIASISPNPENDEEPAATDAIDLAIRELLLSDG